MSGFVANQGAGHLPLRSRARLGTGESAPDAARRAHSEDLAERLGGVRAMQRAD
jgi:hypothetical protein